MAIAALIIALLAAAFTGYHVYLAFKELGRATWRKDMG